jgi:hypothetical protein
MHLQAVNFPRVRWNQENQTEQGRSIVRIAIQVGRSFSDGQQLDDVALAGSLRG